MKRGRACSIGGTEAKHDIAIAEHLGYTRLPEPVTHRRTVEFHKKQRCWMIQDDLTGGHSFSFRFHFAPGLKPKCVRTE